MTNRSLQYIMSVSLFLIRAEEHQREEHQREEPTEEFPLQQESQQAEEQTLTTQDWIIVHTGTEKKRINPLLDGHS